MHFKQFLLFVVATFIACCSATTATNNAAQTQNMVLGSNHEVVEIGRRYLKGDEKTIGVDTIDEERAGVTTPSSMQFLGFLKLPKFQGFSKLPLIKQANAVRKKFGKAVGDAYLKWARNRYNSNPQNFM